MYTIVYNYCIYRDMNSSIGKAIIFAKLGLPQCLFTNRTKTLSIWSDATL